MATYYVNTASSAGGDGTTNNTTGATRAFASLQEANDNITTGHAEDVYIECCGTAADSGTTLGRHLTDDSHTVYVRGNSSDPAGKHPGYWSTSHYRIEESSLAIGVLIYPLGGGTHIWSIEDIQIKNTFAGGEAFEANGRGSTVTNAYLRRCIIDKRNGGNGAVWRSVSYELNGIAYNNAIVGISNTQYGIYTNLNKWWFSAGCNVVIGFGVGAYCHTTTYHYGALHNNAIFNSSTEDINSRWDVVDHCASDDGDGTNPVSISDWANQFYNPNYASELDFRLVEGSDLLNAGAGSSVGGVPSNDIMGETRSASDASVGPYEFDWTHYGPSPTPVTTLKALPITSSKGVTFVEIEV